jgi:methionine-gamma-lyase
MAAISSTVLALCSSGDEVIASRTIYGGTYALLKNLLPRLGITTRFVDICDEQAVRAAITPRTRVLFTESITNPLLEVSDLPLLASISHSHGVRLVVDNTFSPMILSPLRLGADIVVHSMTKFINGTSDCVAGCVVSTHEFIAQLNDVNSGTSMLLGPVLDSHRAASILKNLHSLHLRMRQHSANAAHLAGGLVERGVTVHYPGLATHPQHDLLSQLMNPGLGFGGVMTVDVGTRERAARLMVLLQEGHVGYLAVSLGYFKTLFSAPGSSTSSEIPVEHRHAMGLTDGLIRFSVGLDSDIQRSLEVLLECVDKLDREPESISR